MSNEVRELFGVFLMCVVLLVVTSLLCGALFVKKAYPMDCPENLWKGLVAEACSEGEIGMYAVACCVRNRLNNGMSTGLVALKRKDLDAFVSRQGVKYEKMAKEIVHKVFNENAPDVTKNATHYENVEVYGCPKWAKGMDRTVKIGCHTFFKER